MRFHSAMATLGPQKCHCPNSWDGKYPAGLVESEPEKFKKLLRKSFPSSVANVYPKPLMPIECFRIIFSYTFFVEQD